MPDLLRVKNLHTGYGTGRNYKEIVSGIDFTVEAGSFVCIIGANGCGKTTALRSVLGLLKATQGEILINDQNAREMSTRERARNFAYIPQVHIPPFPFKVADVVLLGRTPHVSSTAASVSTHDMVKAWEAMEQLSITDLAQSDYTELSGGQQQLVLIARALAQEPSILVMDEPTASLDFGNQQLVLTRMHRLSRGGMAVLMVTHDPDHALFCADKVIVMENGIIIEEGSPIDTITSQTMHRIYGTRVCVADVPVGDGQVMRTCVPVMSAEKELA